MKNQPISSGSVPVTFRMAADVAAKIQSQQLDSRPLFELVDGASFTPNDLAETLLEVYFAYTQVLLLRPEEITIGGSALNVHLVALERLYRAFKEMKPSEVSSVESGE